MTVVPSRQHNRTPGGNTTRAQMLCVTYVLPLLCAPTLARSELICGVDLECGLLAEGSRTPAGDYRQPARPKNTRMARPSRTISSSLSRPTRSPSLARGTVATLSTIRLQGSRSPFASSGSIRSRNSGASVGSVVNAHTVTESVASKRSSWMTATGRGLPTYPPPAAAVQISPRFKSRRPR